MRRICHLSEGFTDAARPLLFVVSAVALAVFFFGDNDAIDRLAIAEPLIFLMAWITYMRERIKSES